MLKEYIEREKARELIENYGKNAIDSGRWSLDPVDDIIALAKGVDKIPSADVVEVVRCEKCTHKVDFRGRVMCNRNAHRVCDEWYGLTATNNDHFCSYGIRKED